MPSRRDIFINDNYYHIFNKTIDHKIVFENGYINYFLELMRYYRSVKANIRYSQFKKLPEEIKIIIEKKLILRKYFRVEILAYCFMPNHFHLLIKQKIDNGIIRFMSDIINSFTRVFNLINQRQGPIFIPQFKSRSIVNNEQLIHVSRYIHLNPFSSGIIKNKNELLNYRQTSLIEYLNNRKKSNLCTTDFFIKYFSNSKNYLTFVFNNAEYQKTLEWMKYIKKEKWV